MKDLRARLRRFTLGLLPESSAVPARYWKRRLFRGLEPEMPWFLSATRPGSRIVDVGANVGMYCYAGLRAGHPVVAFEPLPGCARLLESFAAGHDTLAVHRAALGDRPETKTLFVPIRNGAQDTGWASFRPDALGDHHLVSVDVPVRGLDEYALHDIGGIKIDVEGWELPVIRGARATIARERPVLLVEIDQRFVRGRLEDVFTEIAALGYRGEYLDDGLRSRPLETYDVVRHQYGPDGDPPIGRHVNTFLFRPEP